MRTTIDLPDGLYRQVKSRAAEEGLKLKDLVTRYLERGLREGENTSPEPLLRRPPIEPAIKRDRSLPKKPSLRNDELNAILDAEEASAQLSAMHLPTEG